MKKILAFGASNSSNSINRQLAAYIAGQVADSEVILIDLNDFEMPIYSIDREKTSGIPEKAQEFNRLISEADGIVISFAEHNGTYTVAYKNLLDWASRLGKGIWQDKPMFLVSTSPGSKGGRSVLEQAKTSVGFMNGQASASFCLPFFRQNFSAEEGITDPELRESFEEELRIFEETLESVLQEN